MSQRSQSPHAQILATVGKAHLAPLGLKRKGKSRLWFADRGWWLSIVEFQPSGSDKGSYLNVAAMWLWHPSDHFTFNEFTRVETFVPFTDVQSLTASAENLGTLAATAVSEDFVRFALVSQVAAHIEAKADGNPWHQYHAMMSALAIGNVAAAAAHQAELSKVEHPTQWCGDLKARAERIVREAATAEPRAVVSQEVLRTRGLLKLSNLPIEGLWRDA